MLGLQSALFWAKPTHLEWAPIGRKRFWNVMFKRSRIFKSFQNWLSTSWHSSIWYPAEVHFKKEILDAKFLSFRFEDRWGKMGPFCLLRLWPEAKINFVRRYLLKNGNNDVCYFRFFPKGSLDFFNFSCYICLVMSDGAQNGSSIDLALNSLLDWIEKNILGLPDIMCLSFWLLSF